MAIPSITELTLLKALWKQHPLSKIARRSKQQQRRNLVADHAYSLLFPTMDRGLW